MKTNAPRSIALLGCLVALILSIIVATHNGPSSDLPGASVVESKDLNPAKGTLKEAAASPQIAATPEAVTKAQPAALPPVEAKPLENAHGVKRLEMFKVLGATTGQRLDPKSAAFVQAKLDGRTPVGRVTPLNTASLAVISTVRRGDRVSLPLSDHEVVEAVVNLAIPEADGTVRIGGSLTGKPGSFSLARKDAGLSGLIQLPQEGLAYRIEPGTAGATVLNEVLLSDVICSPMPPQKNQQPLPMALIQAAAAPPILNSRPTAVAQVYLDFDGETVTDPDWNGGNQIVAAAFPLTGTDITAIFNRVKEDFWPFNINITTDVTKYNSAPVGQRMRCIITPTKEWYGNAGGVAYRNSFDWSGFLFSSTVPCWVFNSNVIGISEAVSHELGHTFGLKHDGRTAPVEVYFAGHGSGATSYGPIMGACYDMTVVQWSKGEYANANNQEDDLAIISNAANGFGYVPDEAGNSAAAALPIGPSTSISRSGVITRETDDDFYFFVTSGGTVSMTASSSSVSPNLDVALEIQNSAQIVVASSNPVGPTPASVSVSLAAGTYYVKISGSGALDPLTNGYSKYGSIGAYTLTGSGNFSATPVNFTELGGTFESPIVSSWQYNPPVSSSQPWTFNNGAGVATNSLPSLGFGVNGGTTGQFAFLQNAGSISQSVYFPVAGDYALVWRVAGREPASGGGGAASYSATISSGLLSATGSTVDQQGFSSISSNFRVTTPGTYTLTIANTTPGANGDQTFYVDSVLITHPPVATPQTVTATEDTVKTITLAGTDPDGETISIDGTGSPAHGQLQIVSALSVTYTPDANYNGPDSFVFWVADSNGAQSRDYATVTINVGAINDAPSFTIPASLSVVNTGASTTVGFATNIAAGPPDEAGQTLFFFTSATSNSALFSSPPFISSTGTLTFTPAAGAVGTATVSTYLADSGGTATGGVNVSATQTFTLTVAATGAPTVAAPTSTNIATNSATLGGNVTSDSNLAITERGVVYALTSVNASPAIGGTGVTKVTASGTTGAFTVTASSLSALSSYSFKAYATNALGTTYTNPVASFSTLPLGTMAATYASATDVPLTVPSATLGGSSTVNLTLGFAPVTGTNLMVIKNTGLAFINGTYSNLAHGQTVALSYNGVTYQFVANYYGGTGNDLVLQWANVRPLAWGSNGNGQLGINDSTVIMANVPATVLQSGVLAGKTVLALSAGQYHSLALCSDGTVAAWGHGFYGQLSNGTADSLVPVAVNIGKMVVAVSAGQKHSLALCSDGTVFAWGYNGNGELGINTFQSQVSGPRAVDTTSGTSALFGKTVVAISAGQQHSLALCSDGTLVAWGHNGYGQLGNASNTSSGVPVAVTTTSGTSALFGKTVIAVSAGQQHSLALCSDGTVAAWGYRFYGALGDNDGSAGRSEVPVAVNTASGTSALFGRTVVAISAGEQHSLALCSDGIVAAWGSNYAGQLGNNDTTRSLVPVAVNTASGTSALFGRTVVAVSAGQEHSLALCSDGTLAAWGGNSNSQLGDGTRTIVSPYGKLAPVTVSTTTLAAGERWTLVGSGSTAFHTFGIAAAPPPATLPGAPIIGTATGGIASASVTFTAPASNGNSAITSYTATSSPGGFSGTGSASPITVSGLTNGSAYTFTVTATNAVGTGNASAASNSVTPTTVPTVTTGLASSVTASTATLGGTVLANGLNTTVTFEYGLSTSYGSTATALQSPVSGTGSTSVSAAISGLAGHTIYHYRVVGTNSAGTTNGSDATFTTPNNFPIEIVLSAISIAENNVVNVTIGTLSAIDADAADVPTFSLVNGTGSTDNASFTIAGTALKLKPSANFETKSSYAIRIGVNDGQGGTLETPFTITVTDVNEAPTFTMGASQSVISTTSQQVVSGFISSFDDGDSTAVQSLTFNVTGNTNAGLFTTGPAISSTGTLLYTPSGAAGTATISVTLTDDGSINFTPAVTAAAQSFTITVTPATTAQTWAQANGVSGDLSLPGANGQPNLLNFAFGMSPTASSNPPLAYTGNFSTVGTVVPAGVPLVGIQNPGAAENHWASMRVGKITWQPD
jgi:alpha-tubulin suppressor-like RCC1 family protein